MQEQQSQFVPCAVWYDGPRWAKQVFVTSNIVSWLVQKMKRAADLSSIWARTTSPASLLMLSTRGVSWSTCVSASSVWNHSQTFADCTSGQKSSRNGIKFLKWTRSNDDLDLSRFYFAWWWCQSADWAVVSPSLQSEVKWIQFLHKNDDPKVLLKEKTANSQSRSWMG